MSKSAIKRILGQAWDGLAPAAQQGANEIGAVLYTGSGYTVYQKADKSQGIESQQPEQQQGQQSEQERQQERDQGQEL